MYAYLQETGRFRALHRGTRATDRAILQYKSLDLIKIVKDENVSIVAERAGGSELLSIIDSLSCGVVASSSTDSSGTRTTV